MVALFWCVGSIVSLYTLCVDTLLTLHHRAVVIRSEFPCIDAPNLEGSKMSRSTF